MVTRIKGTNIQDGSITLDDIDLSSITTDSVSEGANNFYYTTARANTDIDARVTKSFVDALNVDADTLDGNDSAYFTNASNLSDGTVPTARLGTGTANSTTYLAGDQTWKELDTGGEFTLTYAGGTIHSSEAGTGDPTSGASSNFFVGLNAGNNTTTGDDNTFIGRYAGCSITNGRWNVFIGQYTGSNSTSAYCNNFFGYRSGCCNTTGRDNNFMGTSTGMVNLTGKYNNFFGNYAGGIGGNNCYSNMFGYRAGERSVNGQHNNFIGCFTGRFNGIITSFGTLTGGSGYVDGVYNGVALTPTSGILPISYPTANITVSGGAVTSLTLVSGGLGFSDPTVLYTTSNANLGGSGSGFTVAVNITGGCFNNFMGCQAGLGITTGSDNNFFGRRSGRSTTTGVNNSFIGPFSGACNTTGTNNNFMGRYAGFRNTTGVGNTFIGCRAGCCNTTSNHNTYIGSRAGLCSTGNNNTFVGINSGSSSATGNYNSFYGGYTGSYSNSGNQNTFMGWFAGRYNNSGQYNTFVGAYAGCSNTTGSNNIIIGCKALGSSATVSNEITLGNANITAFRIPGLQAGASNGQVMTYNSSSESIELADAGGGGGEFTLSGPAGTIASSEANLNQTGCGNFLVGQYAGASLQNSSSVRHNIFIGCRAGDTTTGGNCNIGLGVCALRSNTGGGAIGIGRGAAQNYNGYNGVWLGHCAGPNVTSGSGVFIGAYTGFSATSGTGNTFVGHRTGYCNIAGTRNTYIGDNAGGCNYFCAVSIGYWANRCGTSGCRYNPITIGTRAGYWGTSHCSIIIGHYGGYCGHYGCNNIVMGHKAACTMTCGVCSVILGTYAGRYSDTLCRSVVIGDRALSGDLNCSPSTCQDVLIGFCAAGNSCYGRCGSNCGNNIGIGTQALLAAGSSVATGGSNAFSNNIAIGLSAGRVISAGQNIAIGTCALPRAGGFSNIAIGSFAGSIDTNFIGGQNIMMGPSSGIRLTTGCDNIAIGHISGRNFTTGSCNIAVGKEALGNFPSTSSTTGCYNVAMGFESLRSVTSGIENLGIGHQAGVGITTGSCNLTFGKTWSMCNISTQSNYVIMGGDNITTALIQVAWTVMSDERNKVIHCSLDRGKSFLQGINPIVYSFKDRETGEQRDIKNRYGFSAQNVLEAEGDNPVIVDTGDPDNLKITSDYFVPILVNAIKELTAEVDDLKARLDAAGL